MIVSHKTVPKASSAAKTFLVYQKEGGLDEKNIHFDHPGPMLPKCFQEKLDIIAPHKNESARLLLFKHLSHAEGLPLRFGGYCELWPPKYASSNSSCRNRNNGCCKWRINQAPRAETNLRDAVLRFEGKHAGMPTGTVYKEGEGE